MFAALHSFVMYTRNNFEWHTEIVVSRRKFVYRWKEPLHCAMLYIFPQSGWFNYNIIVQLFSVHFVRRWFAIDDFVLFKYDDMKIG